MTPHIKNHIKQNNLLSLKFQFYEKNRWDLLDSIKITELFCKLTGFKVNSSRDYSNFEF